MGRAHYKNLDGDADKLDFFSSQLSELATAEGFWSVQMVTLDVWHHFVAAEFT